MEKTPKKKRGPSSSGKNMAGESEIKTSRSVAYAPGRIYSDAAAATPLHPLVKARLVRLLELYANPGALHKEAVLAKEELEKARAEIATSIGAHPDEIYFTASGTESNNLALLGALRPLLYARPALGGQENASRLHAITITIEHQSVLEPLAYLQRYGLALSLVQVEPDGVVRAEKIGEAIRPDTALISVQVVNSEVGTIQPVREIMKIVRRIRGEREAKGNQTPLIVHTDAAQMPLYLPIRVESLGVDLLTLDAQKVLGPKGVGVLYIRRGVSTEPIMFGGRQERGLRPGTPNVALAGAFAEALILAQKEVKTRAPEVGALRDLLVQEIREAMPDALFNGSLKEGERVANNLNVSIPGLDAETAVIGLDALGVCASTRSACNPGAAPGSHVINALGVSRERAQEAIRLTLLPTITKTDIQMIVNALVKVRGLYGKEVPIQTA